MALSACDTEDPPKAEPPDSDSNGEGDTSNEQIVAFSENFDNWQGGSFYLSKPEGDTTYSDNGTAGEIGGQKAFAVHAPAADNSGYGYGVELQFNLNQQTDFSNEDFFVSFDVYIPAATAEKGAHVQWALFQDGTYTPIYSVWYPSDNILPADEWVTIESTVSTTGDVDYSGFADSENPSGWILDLFRIQVIIDGETAAEGDEVLFYVDNLRVANFRE